MILRYDYDTQEYVSKVTAPVLVIHSRDDQIVPFALGRKVFDAANEPKTFLAIDGDHNSGYFVDSRRYLQGLGEFLDERIVKGE